MRPTQEEDLFWEEETARPRHAHPAGTQPRQRDPAPAARADEARAPQARAATTHASARREQRRKGLPSPFPSRSPDELHSRCRRDSTPQLRRRPHPPHRKSPFSRCFQHKPRRGPSATAGRSGDVGRTQNPKPSRAERKGGERSRPEVQTRKRRQPTEPPPSRTSDRIGWAVAVIGAASLGVALAFLAVNSMPVEEPERPVLAPVAPSEGEAARDGLRYKLPDRPTQAALSGNGRNSSAAPTPKFVAGTPGAVREGLTPERIPPGQSLLHLRSTPPGARVRLDGKNTGYTPMDVRLSHGRYTMELSLAGYVPVQRSVDVAETEMELTFALIQDVAFGTVKITASGWDGAELFVDSRRVGKIPYITDLEQGLHTFRLERGDEQLSVEREVWLLRDKILTLELVE